MGRAEKPVVLVGAYERENFGDLLFLHLSRHYYSGSTVATAPIATAPTPYLKEPVESYVPRLRAGECSGVWAVGGEIGAIGLDHAAQMALDPQEFAALPESRWARDDAVLERTGLRWYASPYLPRLAAYPASTSVPFVVNSAGIRHLSRWPNRKAEVVAALRDADYLSVREDQSSRLLTALGISHTVAPDLVHTIAARETGSIEKHGNLALVQVKESVLRPFGVQRFAEVLAKSRTLAGYRLRLFTAGSAAGHDSEHLYRELAEEYERFASGRQLERSISVTPWEKVAEIASAALWIGSSLHGLIVSTAYGVPRVGLDIEKVSNYANTWRDPMPVGVSLEDVDAAVDSALAVDSKAEARRSAELANLSESSVLACVKILSEGSQDGATRAARRHRESVASARHERKLAHTLARAYRQLK